MQGPTLICGGSITTQDNTKSRPQHTPFLSVLRCVHFLRRVAQQSLLPAPGSVRALQLSLSLGYFIPHPPCCVSSILLYICPSFKPPFNCLFLNLLLDQTGVRCWCPLRSSRGGPWAVRTGWVGRRGRPGGDMEHLSCEHIVGSHRCRQSARHVAVQR